MKRLKGVFYSVLVGCTCAFFLFKAVENKTIAEVSGNAVAVQIGVFTKEENAVNMSKTYGGIVTKDDDLYRVYYSVLSRDANIKFVTDYLKEKEINYYLKKLTIKDEFFSKGMEIEELMEKTKKEAKLKINEELLEMYKDVI